MSAVKEAPNLRRRNFHNALDRMIKQMREWRWNNGPYRMLVPNTTTMTPRMADMDDGQVDYWARRVTTADAEASINRSNESAARGKQRAGEAA